MFAQVRTMQKITYCLIYRKAKPFIHKASDSIYFNDHCLVATKSATMKICKLYILLPVALLITISELAAQQASSAGYSEQPFNCITEQLHSNTSTSELFHVNWLNSSIEQVPEIEISFYTPSTIDRQFADASASCSFVITSTTGMPIYRDKDYFPGLKSYSVLYQKSAGSLHSAFRLYISGIRKEMSSENAALLITTDPGNNVKRSGSPFNSRQQGEVPPAFAPSGPFPVSIVSIKAALKKAAVQINWEAREELQLNLYEVERSTDGLHFQTIGLVFPWDNLEASNNYHFTDQHPLPGISYYRLRSINKDSSYSYSAIVPAGAAPLPANCVSVTPNPVKGNIRAVFSGLAKATYTVELRTASGVLQLRKTITIQQADQLEILQPGYAAPGIYWLSIFNQVNHKLGTSRVVIR